MHKKRKYNVYSYYATILFAISFSLILYGLGLNYYNSHKVIDPVNDVVSTTDTDEGTIHIDTTNRDHPITENQDNGNTTNLNKDEDSVTTINEVNNNLRNSLEKTYEIEIKYGQETAEYSVSGIATEPITDSTTINSQLVHLQNALSLYPRGMFREIKNGGIPLTIILVNKYSDNSITGITDSNYDEATISISAVHTVEDSFYHESYHYIERYLLKKGANYNSWDSLNSSQFSGWGTIDGNLSYSTTFSENASFVNNYAQTSAAEDRASTFEYMMAPSKASCLNRGGIVWRKAKLLADTIDLVLSSVSPDVTEYWERYL